MKNFLVGFLLFTSTLISAQSYIDAGIRHFGLGEYEEALIDFKDAEDIESMITESSRAKLYYYRGLIWLKRAESSSGGFAEEDPLQLSFNDLTKVLSMDPSWEPQIEEAFETMYPLIIREADSYLKLVKKEDILEAQLNLLDTRINYLKMANELEVSSSPILYIGQTNKLAGDLIFDSSTSVADLKKAKTYYEESLKHYELARYDDPFSKEIIQDLLTLSERLSDSERIAEYKKLLELAGG